MEVIIKYALPIAVFIAMTAVFHLLYNRANCKKLWLICDLLVHVALVYFMLYVDAAMEELLLVLLATLAIGMM